MKTEQTRQKILVSHAAGGVYWDRRMAYQPMAVRHLSRRWTARAWMLILYSTLKLLQASLTSLQESEHFCFDVCTFVLRHSALQLLSLWMHVDVSAGLRTGTGSKEA